MDLDFDFSIHKFLNELDFDTVIYSDLNIVINKLNSSITKTNEIHVDTNIGELENPTKTVSYKFININIFSKNPVFTLLMIRNMKQQIKHDFNYKIPLYDFSDVNNPVLTGNHIRVRNIEILQSNLKIDDYNTRNMLIEYEEVNR
jgi:hypothetical protein